MFSDIVFRKLLNFIGEYLTSFIAFYTIQIALKRPHSIS